MNNEKRKHLAIRDRVSDNVLVLLSRAEGLELLDHTAGLVQYVKAVHPAYRLQRDEQFAGYDVFAEDINEAKHVLVTEDIEYPIAGFPEAYDNYYHY